jgi:hypothetical protein
MRNVDVRAVNEWEIVLSPRPPKMNKKSCGKGSRTHDLLLMN